MDKTSFYVYFLKHFVAYLETSGTYFLDHQFYENYNSQLQINASK
jgi:hypothetical protein